MRSLASIFGAATVCALASLASAQQLPQLAVGTPVDYNYTSNDSNASWQSCVVDSVSAANSYNLRCGTTEIHTQGNSSHLRMHVSSPAVLSAAAPAPDDNQFVSRTPEGLSVGARYGTREPRTCDNRKVDISAAARDLFICDSEHEFGGTLYLVSDVSLNIAGQRPYNPNLDAAKLDIDPAQPVVDLRATYNNYQCSQVSSAMMDFPGNKNCNEAKLSNAAAACYKTKAGEWHCQTYDFHPMAVATASNVQPPTLVQ